MTRSNTSVRYCLKGAVAASLKVIPIGCRSGEPEYKRRRPSFWSSVRGRPHSSHLLTYTSPFVSCLLALCLATGHVTNASAGSELSPSLKIIAIEMIDTENVLRLLVRRRIEIGAPALDVNVASCSALSKPVNANGKNSRATHYFDVPLGTIGRSAASQRQLVSESFAAFVSSLPVQLYVRDDACTALGSRLVSGIRVQR